MRSSSAFRVPFAWAFASTCAVLGSASTSAAPQTPYFWPTEYSLANSTQPMDVAATYNGRRAAVRSASANGTDAVVLWDLSTTGQPSGPMFSLSAPGVVNSLAGAGYMPSDVVELTNTRGVSIGSGYYTGSTTLDQCYIDIFECGPSPASPPFHVQLTQGNTGTQTTDQYAGYANDLAITRDGAYTIVNADNSIFVVDMNPTGTPQVWIPYSFNIGGPNWGPNPGTSYYCTPNGAVDSVALTNDVAVTTTARRYAGQYTTWVYVIDLGAMTATEFHILPTGLGEVDDFPHDVAITPDGTRAVVTTTHCVAAYDLMSAPASELGVVLDLSAWRQYQQQVDSVELTDASAVVIADHYSGTTPSWQVSVFDIGTAASPTFGTPVQYGGAADTRAHDLEIAPGGTDMAVVRTSTENVIVTSLTSPPTSPTTIASPNGSDAYAYEGFISSYGVPVFSSDALVIGLVSGTSQYAVSIGGKEVSSGVFEGRVDIIDLLASPPTLLYQRTIASGSTNAPGCVPLDISLSRDTEEVIVHSSDPYADTPDDPGADMIALSLSTLSVAGRYGGVGITMGLDSLAVGSSGTGSSGRKRIVTIAADPSVPIGKTRLVDRQ